MSRAIRGIATSYPHKIDTESIKRALSQSCEFFPTDRFKGYLVTLGEFSGGNGYRDHFLRREYAVGTPRSLWVLRQCGGGAGLYGGMGIGGLVMSVAWFFLYEHMYRTRKQLEALSAAILGAADPHPVKPSR